jgi:hypothetical protein
VAARGDLFPSENPLLTDSDLGLYPMETCRPIPG